jgi:transposase
MYEKRFYYATHQISPCKFRAIKRNVFLVLLLSVYTIHIQILMMPRRMLTLEQKWQVISMRNTGLSLRRIADQFGVSHSVISRLLKRHREARIVKECDRSGRPRKTSPRDDRALSQSARRRPFSTALLLSDNWAIHGRVRVRTVNRRLNCARLKARRPIKRPLLTRRHRHARHQWSRDHRNWNLRQWCRVHWSDPSTPY